MKAGRAIGAAVAKWLRLSASVALLLSGALVFAQQQPQKKVKAPGDTVPVPKAGVSELAKENNDRIAASAAQIRAVVAEDPGLLVELKRWIAKEATDNGQVLSDSDLTDHAVYERLANDTAFRSAATRIVQRYGYLRPNFNPDSALAKEQDLVLKERARRLVQIEAQEDSAALQPPPQVDQARETVQACGSDATKDCAQQEGERPNRESPYLDDTAPRRDMPIVPPERNLQEELRIMRAQTSVDDWGLGLAPNEATTLQNVSAADGRPTDPMSSDQSQSLLRKAAPELAIPQIDRLAGDLGVSTDAVSALKQPASASGIEKTTATSTRRRSLSRNLGMSPSVVHVANPYADVPAIYDLYVQAPSRDGTPQRFGTGLFEDGLRDSRAVPIDLPVGPDYVVGPGDSLAIDLWGGISTRFTRVVDRQGRVTLPEAGPLQVSGRSLGEVQTAVQRAIGTQFRDTSAEVSVSRLRTIRVYVVGEVIESGAYDISSLSTALNALVAAGGVTPRGSLRELKHFRGNQLVERIDAYDLLLRGVMPDAKKFENGDTLMVPPVGPQVTITGMVRRPAIYELRDEKNLAEALDLAGGILPAAALRHVEVQRLEAHEKRTMLSLDLSQDSNSNTQLTSFQVREGDEIHIFPIAPYNEEAIYLQGHVLRPGRYSYHDGMKLTDLIASYKDLLPEPAAHYAEIIRLDAPDFRPNVVSFDLSAAMKNPDSAPKLAPLDTVRVFSRFDFEPAPTVWVGGEVRSPGNYSTTGQARLRDAVYLAGGLKPDAALDTAQLFRIEPDGTSKIFSVNLGQAIAGSEADNVFLQPRDRLLIHRNASAVETATVEITGEVAKPGRYPYTGNMHAQDLIRAAGGLKAGADTNAADLTSYAAVGAPGTHTEISLASLLNGNATEDVPLSRGDVLAIRQKPGWKDVGASVKVSGEVVHSGTFGIQPGERLSSVIERAGGYTKLAYPYGAVLMRREVREAEERSRADLVKRVKEQESMIRATPDGDEQQRKSKVTALSQIHASLQQLEENPPIGRVVIHVQDPVEKWKNTAADMTLSDGDVLFIPKRTSYVMVNGQVFHPTAVSYRSGKSANWYLSQAGGMTPVADKKGAYVLRADGSIVSNQKSPILWSGSPMDTVLRSGDVVVVPEKALKIGGTNWPVIMQAMSVAASAAVAVAYFHP
jgi:protein involved in polysaccharide export with SLBB domain